MAATQRRRIWLVVIALAAAAILAALVMFEAADRTFLYSRVPDPDDLEARSKVSDPEPDSSERRGL